MLTTLVDLVLSPAVLGGLGARVLTVLLRHRLYLYARAVPKEGASNAEAPGQLQHIFVLQNMEPNDLAVPFQLQIGTTTQSGHIRSIEIMTGKEGPFWGRFVPQGTERWVLTAAGMGALETWKIVCTTNEETEELRLVMQGWDLRRDTRRWWVPTLSQGGVRLHSVLGKATRAYAREPESVVWVFIAMLAACYVAAVRVGSHTMAPPGWVWPFGPLAEYIHSLGTGWVPWLDWSLLVALLVVGGLVKRVAVRGLWREVALGYLGDEYWSKTLEIPAAADGEREERRPRDDRSPT